MTEFKPVILRPGLEDVSTATPKVPASAKANVQRHKPGVMNKTEASYADILEGEKLAGDIVWYGFEKVTLKLADDCRVTVDFVVITSDGKVEFREVKGGFIREDSRIKIKVASEMFWFFTFCIMQKLSKKDGGGWKRIDF